MPQYPKYIHNRRIICNVVLIGTCAIIACLTVLLAISFAVSHSSDSLTRLTICGAAFAYICVVHLFVRFNFYRVVAYMLIAFYIALATGIVWAWGLNNPLGLLIFGLVIVLAGILLKARSALLAALLSSLVLVVIQTFTTLGWHTPTLLCLCDLSSFGDILPYCAVFCMLSLVSWLYNREIERSLKRAKEAQQALQQQKATLEVQVQERTAELRQVQLEEMQHMYRFAKLGQLGVTLLHDLANHLTALTLEIDSLQGQKHAKAIAPAMRIIQYLDDVVDSTRERLNGGSKIQTFDIGQKVTEALAFLHYKAEDAKVTLIWDPPAEPWEYTGDPACLSQVVSLLTSNAIDAYATVKRAPKAPAPRVVVAMERTKNKITIHINDWGEGIDYQKRRQLFKPFRSTKKTGLGLGLFLAKQAVETQFAGTIGLSPQTDHTEFIINLPLKK